MTLYLLCGMSFSGKSTLAAAIAEHADAVVVSLDTINGERGLTGGYGVPDEEWARTHQVALARTEQELTRGRSVVVDDTNCFRFLRDDYRSLAQRVGVPSVLLYLDTPEAVLHRRRESNEVSPIRARVLEHVFADLKRKFEPPGPDEQPVAVPAETDFPAWVRENLLPHQRGRVG